LRFGETHFIPLINNKIEKFFIFSVYKKEQINRELKRNEDGIVTGALNYLFHETKNK